MLSDYLKTAQQYLLPKKLLTLATACFADSQTPAVKNRLIRQFIRTYDVNMQEALEENPDAYASFNEFFIRQLKPTARPLANTDVISPVDGFVSELGRIKQGQLLQAKGKYYSVQELMATSRENARAFENGSFATLYLSPKDYHRVHMPLEATLNEMIYVPGQLFSVQPATTRMIPNLFARNERLVNLFDTDFGPMAMIMVGATIVGGIHTSWHGDLLRQRNQQQFTYALPNKPPIQLSQAAEMGYFKLGSTVIVLFGNDVPISWDAGLSAGGRILFGQSLAKMGNKNEPS